MGLWTECTGETEFCGKINCTKDVELTSDLLYNTINGYWFNYLRYGFILSIL